MEEKEIYSRAIALWGNRAQMVLNKTIMMDMMIEEALELTQAILKYRRCKCTDDDLLSEMVDCQIMLNQMKLIVYDQSKYDRIYAYKIDRLQQRIESGV